MTPVVRPERALPAEALWYPSLEGLRTIAIACLVASHIGFWGVPTWVGAQVNKVIVVGWFGTDILLAIAGYLCATSLLVRNVTTLRDAIVYLSRRGLRVLPSYYLFLLLYLGLLPWLWRYVAAGVALPLPLKNSGESSGAALPFLLTASTNLYYAFSGKPIGAALEALFAVGVGVQATVVVTVSFVLFRGSSSRRALLVLIAAAYLVRFNWFQHPWSYLLYANPISRAEPFLWGALIPLLREVPTARILVDRWAARVALFAWGAVLLLASATHSLSVHDTATKLIGYPLLAIASAATVASFTKVATRDRGPRLTQLLGRYVYSAYLWKLPWLATLWGFAGSGLHVAPAVGLFLLPAAGVVGTLALAIGWYHLVEQPLTWRPAGTFFGKNAAPGSPGSLRGNPSDSR